MSVVQLIPRITNKAVEAEAITPHEEITKALVDRLAKRPKSGKDEYVPDSELPGFRLRRTPKGTITFEYRGRIRGGEGINKNKLVKRTLAAQHRSRLVRAYLDSTSGTVQMALLPAYSPDLNPVEYLWAWLKRHALANFCPHSLGELKSTARNKLRSAQNRQSIITACWKQAELC